MKKDFLDKIAYVNNKVRERETLLNTFLDVMIIKMGITNEESIPYGGKAREKILEKEEKAGIPTKRRERCNYSIKTMLTMSKASYISQLLDRYGEANGWDMSEFYQFLLHPTYVTETFIENMKMMIEDVKKDMELK